MALLLVTAAPAWAQDHAGHAAHAHQEPIAPTDCEREAERHRAMGHPVPEGICESEERTLEVRSATEPGREDPDAAGKPDHAAMHHGHMDHASRDGLNHEGVGHGAMQHDAMQQGNAPVPIHDGPPPPEAGSGPSRAADAVWGAEAMARSRSLLPIHMGESRYAWFLADRAEYQIREGDDAYLWDVQGYWGTDTDKFWFKSEGEGSFGEDIEDAEVQALYSRAIGAWFDLQVGVRQDFAPRGRTYAVVGVQGLAPYKFEVDAAAFLSDKGDLTARIEGELDQRITQRLILQPRAELSLAAQAVPELGIGAGLDKLKAGLRLRYEISREFAPYIGVEQEWKLQDSAKFARNAGEDPSVGSFVAGVRFWF